MAVCVGSHPLSDERAAREGRAVRLVNIQRVEPIQAFEARLLARYPLDEPTQGSRETLLRGF